MRGRIGDKVRMQHVLDAIVEIEKYVDGIDIEKFYQNSMMRFACVKQLEIIGEACNHLSDELKDKYKEVEWGQIVGMRNIFIHEYFGVDTNLVWEIICTDLPELKEKMKQVLGSLG